MATLPMVFSADTTGAQAAIAALERKVESLQNTTKRGKGSKADSEMVAAEKQLAALHGERLNFSEALVSTGKNALGSMVATVGAAMSLSAVMKGLVDINKAWSDGISKVDDQLELATVRMAIQTGKGGPDLKQQIDVALGAMKEVPAITTIPEAVQMQTFLASSSVKKEDVESGRAMKALLRAQVAINAFGAGGEVSSKDATRLLTGAPVGFGLEETAENIERMGIVMAGAFKETKMTGEAVPALLGKAPGLERFGITPEQAFAMHAPLVSSNVAAETAATGIQAFGSFLADVKPNQERDRALARVGLSQAEIAPRKGGPTVFQSLERVANALEGQDEMAKNQFFADVFGRENAPAISGMLQQRRLMSDLAVKLGSRTAFDEAQQAFELSDYAQTQRAIVGKDLAAREALEAGGGVSWENVRQMRDAAFAEKRATAAREGEGTFMLGLKQLNEQIESFISESIVGESPKDYAENRFRGDREQTRKIIELLERTAENTAKGTNRNGNVEFGGGSFSSGADF